MGATMTGIIEWTHDAQCDAGNLSKLSLQPARWADDHLLGILFETDKEYDFFAAIAGVRSRFERSPLISLCGVPSNLSWPAQCYFKDFGEEVTGWLHLSEIEACIRHMEAPDFAVDFELEIALSLMRTLVSKLSDPHVRLVFDIESA